MTGQNAAAPTASITTTTTTVTITTTAAATSYVIQEKWRTNLISLAYVLGINNNENAFCTISVK